MINAIGPFWDANETWLVLAVGLLLVAFPVAHGIILTSLYLPVFVLLVGLIIRGVAFDFRAKVPIHRKSRWNTLFFVGSLTASLAQGWMLGVYVLGLEFGWSTYAFATLTAPAWRRPTAPWARPGSSTRRSTNSRRRPCSGFAPP